MAILTNTTTSYDVRGNREDLSDIIYRISPTKTPFLSAIPKVKATNTYHEWQTQDLASVTANAQLEGDVASALAVNKTWRLGNYTQISTKSVIVTGTQQAVKTAGRSNELSYQLSLRSAELKRDMEAALVSAANGVATTASNTTAVGGNTTTARSLRGLEGWLATNLDMGSGGAAPVYQSSGAASNPGTAPTDGTQRAFTEAQVKNVLQLAYAQGGEPDLIMLAPSEKQIFSTFTGGATRMDKAEDKSVTAAVDVYVSDFGTLQVVPNRFQRTRVGFILETEKWALATLRPFQTEDIAKQGDSDQKLIVTEYTLEARNEKSSGAVRDLL